jgi:hypothetical protein
MAGKIIVSRKGEFANRRRNYRLFIDGKEVGSIKSDSSEEFEVEAGTHTVQCKINWCYSPDFKVDVLEGKNSYIRVASGMKFYPPLLILMFIGVFFPVYFKLAKLTLPDWTNTVKIILVVPALVYLLYYLTLNRKRYLLISDDKNNPFN